MSHKQLAVNGFAKKHDVLSLLIAASHERELNEIEIATFRLLMPIYSVATTKNAVKRVERACGVNDTRFYLDHMYFDGEYLNGTDGYRFHRLKIEHPHIGFVNSKLENIVVNGVFPKRGKQIFDDAIRSNRTGHTVDDVFALERVFVVLEKTCFERVILPSEHSVEWSYLADSVNGSTSFTYFSNGNIADPITIIDGGFQALIMPVRR